MKKLCLLALLMLATAVNAQTCRHTTVGVGYSGSYGVVQQQQLYHNNYATHANYGTLIVPKAFLAYVNEFRPTYLGVSDDYRQREFAKQVAEELAKLTANGNNNNGVHSVQNAQGAKIKAVLQSRCISCHSENKNEPNLDGDPELIPKIVRLESFAAVTRNEMPKKGEALPQAEFDIVGEWAKRTPVGERPNATFKPKSLTPEVPPVPELPPLDTKQPAKTVPPKKAIPKAKE